MNGYIKKIYEFSDDDVDLEECWKYSVEVDKENGMVIINYFEMENNNMKLQNTFCIDNCIELIFKTIAKEFDR